MRRAWHPRTGPRVLSVLDDFKLDGRVALVTGAARGIGQALAVGLAEAGADIAVLDLLELDDTTARVEATGRRCCALRRDLTGTTPKSAGEIVKACSRALGGLDILVNNAGIIRRADAIAMGEDDWESVLGVDVGSAFYLSQAAAREFIGAGRPGKIVNIASVLSFQGGVSVASYTAAKSGLAGLTRALANEWAPHRINVNALAPGYFTTEVTAEIRRDPVRSQAMLDRIPAGRWGEPADLMGAVVWLCSDASNYVHGSIVSVDGGWLAR